MSDIILLKQGEIVLKGLNKRSFEMKLISNVKRRLKPFGDFKVYALQSTVYVEPQNDDCDMDGAFEAVQTVFGIASVSRAACCEKDKDAIFETAKEYLRDAMMCARSFKVESKRSDKRFPMTSIQLSQYVGGLLAEEFPMLRLTFTTPSLPSILRSEIMRLMSMARISRVRAVCLLAQTAELYLSFPAELTALFPHILRQNAVFR